MPASLLFKDPNNTLGNVLWCSINIISLLACNRGTGQYIN